MTNQGASVKHGRARIVAVANQKGGVGKTTTVVNLGTYLALGGERVLVVDLDPQGNATSGLGIDRSEVETSIYDALVGDVSIESLVRPTGIDRLDLIASAPGLAAIEVEIVGLERRERLLATALAPIRDTYDRILLDCPPSLGLLTVNALTAAGSVLIPIQAEYYALEGLTQLMATLDLIRDHLNPGLKVRGVLITMFDGRTRLATDVVAEARRHLDGAVFETIVPRSVRLSEAPSSGMPIALYRPGSPGADAYRLAAEEFVRR